MAKMLNATIVKILDIGQFLDIGDVQSYSHAHRHECLRGKMTDRRRGV